MLYMLKKLMMVFAFALVVSEAKSSETEKKKITCNNKIPSIRVLTQQHQLLNKVVFEESFSRKLIVLSHENKPKRRKLDDFDSVEFRLMENLAIIGLMELRTYANTQFALPVGQFKEVSQSCIAPKDKVKNRNKHVKFKELYDDSALEDE